MATMPTFESILLETYQSAGLNTGKGKLRSSEKKRYAQRDISLQRHKDLSSMIVDELLTALGFNNHSITLKEILLSAFELNSLANYFENSVWTFNASKEQIIWTALVNFYVPWAAREFALWNTDKPFDEGMPGGIFWFLPQQPADLKGDLKLPVAVVCDWLIDLLGENTANSVDQVVSLENSDDKFISNFKRNLYNWKNGKTITEENIHKYFQEDMDFPFLGSFINDQSQDLTDRFSYAKQFVNHDKSLTLLQLSHEIPMTVGALERVFNDDSSVEEKERLIELLGKRWKAPSHRDIRQKFLVARTFQDGYIRLLKVLCSGVKPTCNDAEHNKVIQLISLFMNIYNMTIESYQGTKTRVEADLKFFRLLSETPFAFELSWLNPNKPEVGLEVTAEIISHKLQQAKGDRLTDVIPWDEDSSKRTLSSALAISHELYSRWDAIHRLNQGLRQGSVYRNIQACENTSALLAVYEGEKNSPKVKEMALQRLHSITLSKVEALQVISSELATYLNTNYKYTRNTSTRVQELLEQAYGHGCYELYEAVILQFHAKHLLYQNEFEAASEKFKLANHACTDRSYGPFRGEIARDSLALSVALTPLHINHEKLFKIAAFGNMIEGTPSSLEDPRAFIKHLLDNTPVFQDCAASCAEYFWDSLYKPYPGITRKHPGLDQTTPLIKQLLDHIMNADWKNLEFWLEENHAIVLQRTRDVKGQSLLMLLMNTNHALLHRATFAAEIGESHKAEIKVLSDNFIEACQVLVTRFPALLGLNDYKSQAPLMLAANDKLKDLVKFYISHGAAVDQQDFNGRSALHSAAASGCVDSFKLLLDAKADPSLKTIDGMNVLHTAVRMGRENMVHRLLQTQSELAFDLDVVDMAPIKYAIPPSPQARLQMKKQHGRDLGTSVEFQNIKTMLQKHQAS